MYNSNTQYSFLLPFHYTLQESILMEHVSILVNKCTRGGGEKEGVIQQAALLCLRQIINRIGANHSQKFISVSTCKICFFPMIFLKNRHYKFKIFYGIVLNYIL